MLGLSQHSDSFRKEAPPARPLAARVHHYGPETVSMDLEAAVMAEKWIEYYMQSRIETSPRWVVGADENDSGSPSSTP